MLFGNKRVLIAIEVCILNGYFRVLFISLEAFEYEKTPPSDLDVGVFG
ncbi:hypothetical protein HMPREF1863_00481 [Aedoeadaptatus coxii]|uniref:Uncharacterized protein n=1 Tax=Aedoeadaptatus coxii TaxID=755172 RepID=A0A134AHW4_9FIRM|nr:hypothetical protein HMPREF1863_00481 [Peptoniphilus coxii]